MKVDFLASEETINFLAQKGLDLFFPHFTGVLFVVVAQITLNPVHIGLFGTVGVVFEANGFTHYI